jgi:hypothetical protein
MGAPQVKDDSHTWIVALALAIALGLAVVCITVGVLYDAIFSEGPGLSDNATQLLTAAFGGVIGVLGSYIGFRAGASMNGGSNGSDRETTERASAIGVRDAPSAEISDANQSASEAGGDK